MDVDGAGGDDSAAGAVAGAAAGAAAGAGARRARARYNSTHHCHSCVNFLSLTSNLFRTARSANPIMIGNGVVKATNGMRVRSAPGCFPDQIFIGTIATTELFYPRSLKVQFDNGYDVLFYETPSTSGPLCLRTKRNSQLKYTDALDPIEEIGDDAARYDSQIQRPRDNGDCTC